MGFVTKLDAERNTSSATRMDMLAENTQRSSAAIMRQVLELWPYLFIAISIGGFLYIALKAFVR
jgi:predicted transcriptional regulator